MRNMTSFANSAYQEHRTEYLGYIFSNNARNNDIWGEHFAPIDVVGGRELAYRLRPLGRCGNALNPAWGNNVFLLPFLTVYCLL
jgi:hypothetical protein